MTKLKIKGCALCKDLIKYRYDSPYMKDYRQQYEDFSSMVNLKIYDERGIENIKSFTLRLIRHNDVMDCKINFCPICGRDLSQQLFVER